ncbi:thiamine pyrophosphate-binding protein [Streptomyces sp. NBC_01136]|uniref:thiamine pyrophosphate-binding protein n=1 Tax=unclassified Streptomyces TaxID=2593676 RepID=UPI0032534B17|nr:thiamine pyrophosphate-binding protein [Streptomyces sp. NBC_01136]
METGSLTGGEALVRALAAHDVTQAFGIPGTHNLEIYRHLAAYGVRHTTPRHEQGAGYAADGYARVTGRPGVVITRPAPRSSTSRDDRQRQGDRSRAASPLARRLAAH